VEADQLASVVPNAANFPQEQLLTPQQLFGVAAQ